MLILHVEDDPLMARAVNRSLKNCNTLVQVSTMQEFRGVWDGSSKAPGGSFDLVITDMEFPGGNGLQVAELAAAAGIPCLVFSGAEPNQDVVAATGAQLVDKTNITGLINLVGALASRSG